MASAAQKPSRRRDQLRQIQDEMQTKWVAEEIASVDYREDDTREKYFVTFPYPYMNGYLHLGHAFSLAKCDFAVNYKALRGYNVLFPFGFHCTGMPIQAAANNLRREIEQFGNPPTFPAPAPEPVPKPAAKSTKAVKSKVQAKTGGKKYQWEILKQSGVPDELLPTFVDPMAWLEYFPGEGIADVTAFGSRVDWRRSFITTDVNPFYNAFVRWQFNKLKTLDKVKFGKRLTIFSPRDGQACADHDRSSGEGVGPQEYTLIKLCVLLDKLDTPNYCSAVQSIAAKHPGSKIILPAATLRPETMYGQTNCWVLPTGDYVAIRVVTKGEIWILTDRAARNLSYQGLTQEYAQFDVLANLKGSDLIGLPLKAPNSLLDCVFVLPLLSVSTAKGTGVVTSVPSDAPDDYRGLLDLQEKEPLRAKFSLRDEWVVDLKPIPIIDTPDYGTLAAVTACEKFKVKSQNDRDALDKAKEEVYRKGFYGGSLIVGTYAGEKVEAAKEKIKDAMVRNGLAVLYSEPEKTVMSRSGDECVVALLDQWYLDYGEKEWCQRAFECLESMETYHDETRKQFKLVLDWLHEWACSRSFGLGTKLPWDTQFVIESLSDSTIYMAYYTVAHLLQGTDNLDGTKPSPLGLTPQMMTDDVWDYVFQISNDLSDEQKQVSAAPIDALQRLRSEFGYWYPLDMRSSGYDLIKNHLTMFIYNHVAIFPKHQWPKSIRTNGFMTINGEKMSKSTGNFLSLRDAIAKYSSDGVRFALADAGDSCLEEANFVEETADGAILKLTTLIAFAEDGLTLVDSMRSGLIENFHDRVFEAALNQAVTVAESAFDKLLFRDALNNGFHILRAHLGHYGEGTGADQGQASMTRMHKGLFLRYIEWQAILIAPFCPHTADYIWRMLQKKLGREESSILRASWPVASAPDATILEMRTYIERLLERGRVEKTPKRRKGKSGALPVYSKIVVYICKELPDWQLECLEILSACVDPETKMLPENDVLNPKVMGSLSASLKKQMKKIMPFIGHVRDEIRSVGLEALDRTPKFDQEKLLEENKDFLLEQLGLTTLELGDTLSPAAGHERMANEALPDKPGFVLVE